MWKNGSKQHTWEGAHHKPAQALKPQCPVRTKILPPKQDQALSGCDQEVAAVGIRGLHQLELLNAITALNETPTISLWHG
jgi:hypothetical protein